MSAQAESDRRQQQSWAKSGGPHDRTVRLLQIALPAAVGALTAIMLFAPFSQRGELSFLLAKDDIAVAPQRMRVDQATYRGRDNQGRAFSVSAGSAIQRSAADPVVRLTDLSAEIALEDGPASLVAPRAAYDPSRELVMADGALDFRTADGFSIATGDVTIDLNRRTVDSASPVTGRVPIGLFSADHIRANLETRTITLAGNARLRINQGVIR